MEKFVVEIMEWVLVSDLREYDFSEGVDGSYDYWDVMNLEFLNLEFLELGLGFVGFWFELCEVVWFLCVDFEVFLYYEWVLDEVFCWLFNDLMNWIVFDLFEWRV